MDWFSPRAGCFEPGIDSRVMDCWRQRARLVSSFLYAADRERGGGDLEDGDGNDAGACTLRALAYGEKIFLPFIP